VDRDGVERELSLRWEWTGDRVLIQLRGELDLAGLPRLEDCVQAVASSELATDVVILDLSGLRFVDLVGVRGLAEACQALRRLAGWLRIDGVGEQMSKVIEMSGIDIPELAATRNGRTAR
jgi:anti-anti-sigma factor